MRKYHTHKIRQLLTEGFDDQILRDLCFDEFKPVYQKLSSNTGKAEIVGKLIEYAGAMSQLDNLLNWAKEKNYPRYLQYQPYFEDTEDPYSNKAEEYFALGTKAMLRGDYGEARRYFSMVLNIDPYYPRAKELLDEAEKLYQKAKTPFYPRLLLDKLRDPVWGGIAGIITILALGWSVYTFIVQNPNITPTPIALVNTPTATATSYKESTATPPVSIATPVPSSEAGTPPSFPTTNYGGILAIPVAFNFGSKVYLTGFDAAGINGPNPVSLDAQQPMFSRDGKSIVVKAAIDGLSGLYKLTAAGFDPEVIIERGSGEWPVLSPDGETMMFSDTTLGFRLQVRKPDGTVEELPLKNEASLSVKNLLWSEDNQLIFQGCATSPNQSDSCGIWITNVNNLEPKLMVENKDAYPMSARAGSLAYMSKEDGDWEIYLMPLNGGTAVKLTDNNFEDGLPAISPDGNAVAYISNESGTWGLWTVNLDGQNKNTGLILILVGGQLSQINGAQKG